MTVARRHTPQRGRVGAHQRAEAGTATFVGRSAELAALTNLLPAHGRGGAALRLIVGDPGIGKTRLCGELGKAASASGHRVLWGRCWDEAGAPPFWPWTQVVRQLHGRGAGVELAPLVLAEADPSDRFELFDAAAASLQAAAARQPLVVIFDDLHLSDPPSLLLLRFVVAHLGDVPLLLLGTYRPTDAAQRGEIAAHLAALEEVGETMSLDGLDVAAVGQLIGSDAPAAEVHAVTGGNPLFVEQVLKSGGGRPDGAAALHVEPSSAALRATMAKRLEPLPAEVRQLLAVVAVLGPSARREDAAHLAGCDPSELHGLARPAIEAGLLEATGDRLTHPLVAEAALEGVGPDDRAALHLAAAGLISERAGRAAELAHHLCRAGPSVWSEAVAACRAAADVATGSLAHEDAVTHLQRALALLQDHPDEVAAAFEVTLALGGALERATGRVPGEAMYRRALELARRSGDPVLVARAAARHGIQYYFGGDVSERRAAECREGLAGLPPADSPLRARLLANLAAAGVSGPDLEASRAMAHDAVAMARRTGDPVAIGVALVAQQVTDLGPATLPRRLETAREIVALAELSGHHALTVHGRFLLKNALLERGDARELDAQLVAQRQLIDHIAEPRFARHSLWFRAMRAMLDGDADAVAALAEECYAIAEQLEDPDGIGVYFGQLGVGLWMRGRLMELEPGYVDLMRSEPDEPLWPGVVAWLSVTNGRPEAARGLLSRFCAVEDIPHGQHTLLTLFTMADVAAEVGDDDLVASLWDACLPYADHVVPIGMGAGCFGVLARPLGGLALRLGHTEEALAHYELAVSVCARLGARPWLVDAQIALADALVDLGRGDDPRVGALVLEASTTASDLGLAVFDDRLAALRERLDVTRGPAPVTVRAAGLPPEPLTTAAGRARPRISVLGTFEVTALDGSSPRWTSRKARSLLKVLVARRGVPASRELLMELLWPGQDPTTLGNRLSVALSTVRRAMDPGRTLPASALVAADGGALRLVLRNVEVDAERFLRSGQSAVEAHRRRDPDTHRWLAGAVAEHSGEAFADEPYEPWAEGLRSEVASMLVTVLRLLAEEAVASGDQLSASSALRRLLDVDPFDEHAHLQLVRALRSLGAHGQARAAYERYAAAMEELGVPVAAEEGPEPP
ncbi:MAG: AAA family ATPase [Acidimicrobiales bacterium]